MSKKEPEFCWKTPPPGEQYPTVGELVGADEWEEDADVLEWFAETSAPGALKDEQPLSKWILVLRLWSQEIRSVGHNDPRTFEGWAPEQQRAYVIDRVLARVAAWSVRALEGSRRDGQLRELNVDAGFVRDELCGVHDTRPNVVPMPAGVATLYSAGRCALIGGRRLSIFGSKSQSKDIEWLTSDGGRVCFEVKSRSVYAGFHDSMASLRLDVASKVRQAAPRLRKRVSPRDATRALSAVCYTGVVRAPIPPFEESEWQSALSTETQTLHGHDRPHVVIVRLLGVSVNAIQYRQRSFLIEEAYPPPPYRARKALERIMNPED